MRPVFSSVAVCSPLLCTIDNITGCRMALISAMSEAAKSISEEERIFGGKLLKVFASKE